MVFQASDTNIKSANFAKQFLSPWFSITLNTVFLSTKSEIESPWSVARLMNQCTFAGSVQSELSVSDKMCLDVKVFPAKQNPAPSLCCSRKQNSCSTLSSSTSCTHRILSLTWRRKWLMMSEFPPPHPPSLLFPPRWGCVTPPAAPPTQVFPSPPCWSGICLTASIDCFVTRDRAPSCFESVRLTAPRHETEPHLIRHLRLQSTIAPFTSTLPPEI